MSRVCSKCGYRLHADEFSGNQWSKGVGISQCMDCVSQAQQPVQCDVCDNWYSSDNALEQHMRTHPVCEHCDEQFLSRAALMEHMEYDHNICDICGRDFRSANGLFQHSKTHVPKNVSCPICGDKKFRNAANAVAHVESGYCSGCRGKDFARTKIHQFMTQNAPIFLAPMIENGPGSAGVPDRPYRCTCCSKTFTSLSAQMNHEGDVHGNDRRLHQLGW